MPAICLTFLRRGGVRGKAKVRTRLKGQTVHVVTSLRLSVPAVKEEAKALIKKFFSRVQRCESEADWKHLKAPHGLKTSENKD